MAINLSRNSKVLFTTNLDRSGKVQSSGFTPNNTFELQVLDGYSFSQNANSEVVTISEAGAAPARSQRSFNTSLAPVDFSLSTYIRPYYNSTLTKSTAEERVLWNALLNSASLMATNANVILGQGGVGTITGISYVNSTKVLTITGTGFLTNNNSTLLVGEKVLISGLKAPTDSTTPLFNSYATVTTLTATSITLTLNIAVGADATFTFTNGQNASVTLAEAGAYALPAVTLLLGAPASGGIGALTTVVYNQSTGVLTISSAAFTPSNVLAVGDTVMLSNIVGATGAALTVFNNRAVVTNITATQYQFTLVTITATATTFTGNTLVGATKLHTSVPSNSVVLGVGGIGTVGAITYSSNTLTIPGTSFPNTASGGLTLASGDVVVLSGLTVSTWDGAGATVAQSAQFNSLATVTGVPATATGSFTFALANAISNTVTFSAAGNNLVTITEVSSAPINVYATIAPATVTSAAYTYSAVTGKGSITLNAVSGLPLIPTGQIFTLTGISVNPSTGTPSTPTVAVAGPDLNTAVYVEQNGDSTATSLKLTYVVPDVDYTAIGWSSTPTSGTTGLQLMNNAWIENSTNAYVSTANSDQNKLEQFGMVFLVDNVMYAVDNCALTQVSVDYGLDQITTAQWTGQGTTLRQLDTGVISNSSANIFTWMPVAYFTGGVVTGAYQAKNTAASYITNKLTTLRLTATKDLKTSAGVTAIAKNANFDLPITGGNLTINNNITYLTPTIMNMVNQPVNYYVGTRAITGNVTAYLKTGTSNDAGVLMDGLLDVSDNVTEPMFTYRASIGGATAPYVLVNLPAVFLQVPTLDAQQIVSTTINFTAQGSSTAASVVGFDSAQENELVLRYFTS